MKYGVISFEGNTVNGLPVFDGTNVAIQILFEYLEDGKTMERFLDDYPAVKKKGAVEVLQLAKLAVTSEKLLSSNYPLK